MKEAVAEILAEIYRRRSCLKEQIENKALSDNWRHDAGIRDNELSGLFAFISHRGSGKYGEPLMRAIEQELVPGPIATELARLRESAKDRRSLLDRPIVSHAPKQPLWKPCPTCIDGWVTAANQRCKTCFGTGRLPINDLPSAKRARTFPGEGCPSYQDCPDCEATGIAGPAHVCGRCFGTGRLPSINLIGAAVSEPTTIGPQEFVPYDEKTRVPAAPGKPYVVKSEVVTPETATFFDMVKTSRATCSD